MPQHHFSNKFYILAKIYSQCKKNGLINCNVNGSKPQIVWINTEMQTFINDIK